MESTLQVCATPTCLLAPPHNFLQIFWGFICLSLILYLVSVTIHFLPFFGRTYLFLSPMLCFYHNYYKKALCLHLAKSNLFNANQFICESLGNLCTPTISSSKTPSYSLLCCLVIVLWSFPMWKTCF